MISTEVYSDLWWQIMKNYCAPSMSLSAMVTVGVAESIQNLTKVNKSCKIQKWNVPLRDGPIFSTSDNARKI